MVFLSGRADSGHQQSYKQIQDLRMWIGCGFVLALEQAAIERTNTASFPRIGGYYDLKRIVNR
jgi:hypothetical protein